jgi:predicted nucleic acid-binding protein
MKRVFADTLYWVAITLPEDPWRAPALDALTRLGDVHLVTTDEVLSAFLTALSGTGSYYRRQAVQTVHDILADNTATVLPQSRETFLDGVRLYGQRADKGYSLADCISMNACRSEGITEVLTNDRHFIQEGFVVLIQRAP